MKPFYSIALFLCSLFFASNTQAATQSFNYSGSIRQGETKSHQFSIQYDGTLTMTLSVNSSGSAVTALIKRAGTPIMGTGTGSTSTTKPVAVSAGDAITIDVQPAHINPTYGYAYYSVRCTLTYTPNSPPAISAISATPSSTTYGNAVTVNVSASDVDGNLSYVRFTKGSASVDDTTAPYANTYSGLPAGAHSVTAYAVDSKAESASASVSFTISKANPSVTAWPSASTITYGQTLASSALSGGSANITGSFTWSSSGTAPTAGTRGYTVVFTPTDTANYNSLTNAVNVATNKANPGITAWPSASTITYGQTLASSALSGGKANIAGSFTWTNSGTKPAAGTRGYMARFTPTDTTNYNSPTHSVSVKTNKANPSVTAWPSASTITYGQTLASSALSGGKANIAGSFTWTNSGTKPAAGTRGYTVRFTPTDTTNYNSPTHSVSVKTNKANPSVTAWPSASTITYGQTLASSKLSGGKANIAGSFAWTSSGTKPTAGTRGYTVRFTPTDTTNYNSPTHSVSVKTNKANPSVTAWPSASTITYGQTLASSKLSGGKANIAGSFAWTSSGTKPTAGTRGYTVRFTPKDSANYNSPTHSVSVITNKATKEVSVWPSASTITYGQSLANSTLSGGTASVSGSFSWVSLGTKPTAGTHSYVVKFTPTDTTNYNTVSGTISISVNKANPAISKWPKASTIIYGQTLASSSLTGATVNITGSFAWTSSTTKPTTIGSNSYTVKFTPSDTKNYNSLTHSVSVVLNKATPSITAWPTASTITYGQTLASSKLNAGKATVGGSFAWTSSGTKPAIGTHSYTVRFSPSDSTHYNSVTHSVSIKATADPNSDLDGDGITYAEELKLGTNPDIAAVSDSSNATKLSVF